MFEADASRQLRTHYQEISYNITTVNGTDTYALPDDFLAPRELSIATAKPLVVLDYLPPTQLDDTWIWNNAAQPFNYTIEGSNVRFGPTPGGVYTIRVEYWQAIPALSDDNASNWLLAQFPDAYLWGSLAEAELFLGADNSVQRFQLFVQRREAAYAGIKIQDQRYRLGGAALTMRTDTGNP
ncbi:MAG TPA: hypothetical protein VHY35_10480 [Stellaceae bacterium]|nr:hypothetical protein [Stellaceae bacterium]